MLDQQRGGEAYQLRMQVRGPAFVSKQGPSRSSAQVDARPAAGRHICCRKKSGTCTFFKAGTSAVVPLKGSTRHCSKRCSSQTLLRGFHPGTASG
eukprot:1159081-Pelagomonas_calceolata.AAC.9